MVRLYCSPGPRSGGSNLAAREPGGIVPGAFGPRTTSLPYQNCSSIGCPLLRPGVILVDCGRCICRCLLDSERSQLEQPGFPGPHPQLFPRAAFALATPNRCCMAE